MTTLEDKILGYKAQNYASSSESEAEEENENQQAGENASASVDLRSVTGAKTGPKGVIEDFRRYKQLETQQKKEQEEELQALIQKFSISCQSNIDDEKEKALMKELEIEEDEFLKQYHFKRLLQMKEEQDRKISEGRPQFRQVLEIPNSDNFLQVIDKELLHVVVVIHLYDENIPSCCLMNECLEILSKRYPSVKFCKVKAEITGISANFRENGLPALLVYKGQQLVGNFVQLENVLGDNFDSSDLESYLIQNHILTEEAVYCGLSSITDKQTSQDDNDSDLELD